MSLDPALLQIAAVGSVTVALYDGRVAAVGVFVARGLGNGHQERGNGVHPNEIVSLAPWFERLAGGAK